jgi:hypothetical protein
MESGRYKGERLDEEKWNKILDDQQPTERMKNNAKL